MEIGVDKDGVVATSDNNHYRLVVSAREERDYPNSTIARYEIINNMTEAVEGRIANIHMALLVMNEFDRRVQGILDHGLENPNDISMGIPVDMDLGERQH